MRIIPIINQLKASALLLDGHVEPAQALISLPDDEVKHDLPIAFIYTADENANQNDLIGGVSQQVPKRFSVMIAAQNIDLTAGTEALEDVRADIMTALLGFQIDDNHSPINYESGKILDASKRLMWWVDTYSTWTIVEA